MTIKLTLPFGKENIKNLVFSILTDKYPLKLIQIKNIIEKQYGKSVSFQAVRKAVLQLTEEQILVKENNTYLINKEWVINSKSYLDKLYLKLASKNPSVESIESIRGELTVFNFNSLNELLNFWQDFVYDWINKYKKNSKINCYQAAFPIEGILHTYKEQEILKKFKQKGIKSYFLTYKDSILNKYNIEFHKKIGSINIYQKSKNPNFDENTYIGTYGDLILQTEFPNLLTKKLKDFFKKNKSLKKLDLIKLTEISNQKHNLKLIVIKNKAMVKHINESIIQKVL